LGQGQVAPLRCTGMNMIMDMIMTTQRSLNNA
jgi:hypothetical protein